MKRKFICVKPMTFLVILILLRWNSFASSTKDDGPALWLLTARVTQSSTLRNNTTMKFDFGGHVSIKERHVTIRTTARGEITAIIENQAEDPINDFSYISDAGETKSVTVSGEGSHTESSNYRETIDGKLINADISDIIRTLQKLL